MNRWSVQDLAQRLAENPALRIDRNPLTDAPTKVSKYRAKKTQVGPFVFDSKREASRYQELVLLEQAGAIRALAMQPTYDLWANNQRICRYRADFTYLDAATGKSIVEDCKGVRTPVYKLKKKLMQVLLGIEILET